VSGRTINQSEFANRLLRLVAIFKGVSVRISSRVYKTFKLLLYSVFAKDWLNNSKYG